MPLLTLHSINRSLLTLELGRGYVKPGRFAGLAIYHCTPLLWQEGTNTEHSQLPARLPGGLTTSAWGSREAWRSPDPL